MQIVDFYGLSTLPDGTERFVIEEVLEDGQIRGPGWKGAMLAYHVKKVVLGCREEKMSAPSLGKIVNPSPRDRCSMRSIDHREGGEQALYFGVTTYRRNRGGSTPEGMETARLVRLCRACALQFAARHQCEWPEEPLHDIPGIMPGKPTRAS